MRKVIFPNINVPLLGHDHNGFAIIERAVVAMKRKRLPVATINNFIDNATRNDYKHLIKTVTKWFNTTSVYDDDNDDAYDDE